MSFLFCFLIFIFGLCIGSFLNVLVARLPKEQGIGGRSYCPHCRHRLGWQDLIPLVSFLALGGKCRYCRKKISWQYPIVEIATGILFVFSALILCPELVEGLSSAFDFAPAALRSGDIVSLFFYLFVVACLIVIFVSDLRYFIIPDEIIISGAIVAFLYRIFSAFNFFNNNSPPKNGEALSGLLAHSSLNIRGGWEELSIYILSSLAAAAFFLAIVLLTRGKGMGLGDVKLAFLMGLILGWPKIMAALFLAFLSGAVVGVGLILAGRAKMKSEIPFGTFLTAATFLTLLFGDALISGWLNIFL